MDISPISQTASSVVAAGTSSSSVISSDFETFLKMLTAQAKYQDPLEPIDSSEYASQLAQFSSVEQQVQTNDLLTAMSAQLGISDMAQYAGWIGMEARNTGPVHFDGQPITLSPSPAATADQAFLVVSNAFGNEVQRMSIPTSSEPVVWAGVSDEGLPFDTGAYSFSVESNANGQLVSTTPTEVYSRVTETRVENGQTLLILEGDIRVQASEITALREAEGA